MCYGSVLCQGKLTESHISKLLPKVKIAEKYDLYRGNGSVLFYVHGIHYSYGPARADTLLL